MIRYAASSAAQRAACSSCLSRSRVALHLHVYQRMKIASPAAAVVWWRLLPLLVGTWQASCHGGTSVYQCRHQHHVL